MEYLSDAAVQAFALILAADRELQAIITVSLQVSLVALVAATLLALPLGAAIALGRFPGRGLLITLLQTLMGFPTVVVGLLVYCLVSRNGPLSPLDLLFTPAAMIIGQAVLALPIIASLTIAALHSADPRILLTARTLGAGPLRAIVTLLAEARFAMVAAVVTAFGRIIGEVGVSMMLGGNIRGYTRNIPTASALETSKGDFSLAIALGMVLLAVALGVNLLLRILQERGHDA